MEEMICRHCGGNQFKQIKNPDDGIIYQCLYCRTKYYEDGRLVIENDLQSESSANHSEKKPKPKKKKLSRSFLIIALVLWGTYQVLGNHKSDSSRSTPPKKVNFDAKTVKAFNIEIGTIDNIAGWSKKRYKKVVIATENYDEKSGEYTYSGGMSYDELLKTVGKPPSSTTSYSADKYSPAHTNASWDLDKNGDYAIANVSITYDNKTRMVISKNCYPDIDE